MIQAVFSQFTTLLNKVIAPKSMPKAALVTGGSRGIGRAIAVELARIGYAVGVNYASRADVAEDVCREIAAAGGKAVPIGGNVGISADREELLNRLLDSFGRIDVLVNNAGITSPGRKDILDATEDSWDQVFDINLKGPFFLSQLAARKMIEQNGADQKTGGKIVNISSISAFTVSTNRGDYCLTKAAMQMMTQLFAVRLADEGIGVFELCPGIVESDMTSAVKEKYDRLIDEGLTPIRRWGRPDDIARAVSAIASDAFPFSTGERIHIDGGFHIRRL
jgi:3-oxoacyl-[acyl-carrier protein] reductase